MMLNSESLSFEQLITLYPEQTWIEISDHDRATAQQETNAHRYSNDTARDRAFQNALCLNAITNFLAEDPDFSTVQAWLPPDDRPPVWELVNGSILTVGNTRLAIVPTDSDRFDALKVEQEWIDIPDWAAHYYLGVQLNLEANWLRIVGYATHNQLKHSENFSDQERVYCLSRSQLIEDLNVMWMAREVSPDWNPIVTSLSELSPASARDLIEQLGQVTAYSPRLERSFAQWGPLVMNSDWRRSLHQRRLEYVSPIAHLGRWMQENVLEPGWQAVQDWTSFPQLEMVGSKGSNLRSIRQGWQQAIVLDQETFNLIVVCQLGAAADQIEVTLIIQRSEATPLLSQLQVTLTEQNAMGQETPFFSLNFAAGTTDHILRLPSLTFSPKERFTVTLRMHDSHVTQEFLV